MTTKHEKKKKRRGPFKYLNHRFIDTDRFTPALYRISFLDRPALQISLLRARLLKELSAFI